MSIRSLGRVCASFALALAIGLGGPSRPAFAALAVEVLKAFEAENVPADDLALGPDDALYGTTAGGPHGAGALYRFAVPGSFERLHSFATALGRCTDSAPLLLGKDGALYGRCRVPTVMAGAVFRADPAGNVEVLRTFEGGYVTSMVVGGDGALYGSTIGGGTLGLGSVFRLDADGHFDVLFSLDRRYGRTELVVGSTGVVFGYLQGENYVNESIPSRLFRIEEDGSLAIVHTFPIQGQGFAYFIGSLAARDDGSVVGTACCDRSASDELGVVFVVPAAGEFGVLHSFARADGLRPYSAFFGEDGVLHGVAYDIHGNPSYFAIDAAGNFDWLALGDPIGSMDSLYAAGAGALYGTSLNRLFALDGSGGATQVSDVELVGRLVHGSDGALYGISRPARKNPRIFRLGADGAVSFVHEFVRLDGLDLQDMIALGSDSTVYGVTLRGGGAANSGTLFRVDGQGGYERVHSFDLGELGLPPSGLQSLVRGGDGAIYGVTPPGRLFRVDPAGPFSQVHEATSLSTVLTRILSPVFGGVLFGSGPTTFRIDGSGDFEPLLEGVDRETCEPDGGAPSQTTRAIHIGDDGAGYIVDYIACATDFGKGGTLVHPFAKIFRIDAAGSAAYPHLFAGYENLPQSKIVALDGSVYGTIGKAIFRTDAAGAVSNLHTFADSESVSDSLVLGGDGKLYFFTYNPGAIYRLDPSGTLTAVHSLAGDGFASDLVPFGDGSLLGVLGTSNRIVRIDREGAFGTVHAFSQEEVGCNGRCAPFVPGPDGSLFGTTYSGGATDFGTLYKVDRDGVFHSLFAYGPDDFGMPSPHPIAVASDGVVYGVSRTGGPAGGGFVYRLVEAGPVSPSQTIHFDPLPDHTLGEGPFTVTATATSGLPVAFGAEGSCTVSGDQVTLAAIGPCKITASQLGDGSWDPAPEVSRELAVRFDFDGFLSPVAESPAVNRMKAGRAVAIRFKLDRDRGADVLASGSPTVRQVPCDSGATGRRMNAVTGKAKSVLLHKRKRRLYTYRWVTDKSWAGTCRQISLELTDGAIHRAVFLFDAKKGH